MPRLDTEPEYGRQGRKHHPDRCIMSNCDCLGNHSLSICLIAIFQRRAPQFAANNSST
ncbi:hypothetical protein VFPPC_16544 [Pochonia chlamydosporia 170]|uniref:Uncharacterized protein n=1 Tax=Pochonia chlamydosporia 170 TaxID=1380566 RepID=A0A179F8J2_METCM|nr:hypothetical protein VFPPC_16544 [Pochonia chlamydosporia 170]OAQ61697.1 hypothetical protein VFPPC_16544 [Pochonia chlamydosporia 170]